MPEFNTDTDPRGSNSLIRSYLASKGLQSNGENIRRALEGNAANSGLIPGLVNSTPSTEADDQAAMAAAARGRAGAGGGNTSALPTPPLPPAQREALPDVLPPADASGDSDIAMQILRGLGLGLGGPALIGAAAGAGRRIIGNRSGAVGDPDVNITPPRPAPTPGEA